MTCLLMLTSLVSDVECNDASVQNKAPNLDGIGNTHSKNNAAHTVCSVARVCSLLRTTVIITDTRYGLIEK